MTKQMQTEIIRSGRISFALPEIDEDYSLFTDVGGITLISVGNKSYSSKNVRFALKAVENDELGAEMEGVLMQVVILRDGHESGILFEGDEAEVQQAFGVLKTEIERRCKVRRSWLRSVIKNNPVDVGYMAAILPATLVVAGLIIVCQFVGKRDTEPFMTSEYQTASPAVYPAPRPAYLEEPTLKQAVPQSLPGAPSAGEKVPAVLPALPEVKAEAPKPTERPKLDDVKSASAKPAEEKPAAQPGATALTSATGTEKTEAAAPKVSASDAAALNSALNQMKEALKNADPDQQIGMYNAISAARSALESGGEITPDMLKQLPADVAASLLKAGIAKLESPATKMVREAKASGLVKSIPIDIYEQYRGPDGIASIPEMDTWVATGGLVNLPLPGGGDIKTPEQMKQFGLEP